MTEAAVRRRRSHRCAAKELAFYLTNRRYEIRANYPGSAILIALSIDQADTGRLDLGQ